MSTQPKQQSSISLTIVEQKQQYTKVIDGLNTAGLEADELEKCLKKGNDLQAELSSISNLKPFNSLYDTYLNGLTSASQHDYIKEALSENEAFKSGDNIRPESYYVTMTYIVNASTRTTVKPTEGRSSGGKDLYTTIAQAKQNLEDKLDIANYKAFNTKAIDLVNPLRGRLRHYEEYLIEAVNQLNNKNSKFRASISNTKDEFVIPDALSELIKNLAKCSQLIDNIKTNLNLGKDLNKDIAKNILLSNAGYAEDPKNPGTFIANTVEKDPWGIRFSILHTNANTNALNTIQQRIDKSRGRVKKELKKAKDGSSLSEEEIHANELIEADNKKNESLKIRDGILDGVVLQNKINYYMHLLPAIRSNLPIQGGTDVPGVQPGLNFRIEHSIVKHKIPGFQPIYQPLGVESIKCTLVGCFTGADGTDLLSEQDQIKNAIKTNQTTSPVEFYGRGDLFESIQKNKSIPGGYLNQFANITRAYDAFKNAEDFYRLIVGPGKEIEVELNLKKNELVNTGGGGIFRDEITGNPKFKAYIRRMDMYYVRADRCWYILDLEVTNGGLIGNKCINLTKEIVQATQNLEQAQKDVDANTVEDDKIIKCIENSKQKNSELKFNDKQKRLVVDGTTGYGYTYSTLGAANKKVLKPIQVVELLAQTSSSDPRKLDQRIGWFNKQYDKEIYIAKLVKASLSNIPSTEFSLDNASFNGLNETESREKEIYTAKATYKYDSNSNNFVLVTQGKFYNQDKIVPARDFIQKIIDKDINVTGEASVDKVALAFLGILQSNEDKILPCDRTVTDDASADNTSNSQSDANQIDQPPKEKSTPEINTDNPYQTTAVLSPKATDPSQNAESSKMTEEDKKTLEEFLIKVTTNILVSIKDKSLPYSQQAANFLDSYDTPNLHKENISIKLPFDLTFIGKEIIANVKVISDGFSRKWLFKFKNEKIIKVPMDPTIAIKIHLTLKNSNNYSEVKSVDYFSISFENTTISSSDSVSFNQIINQGSSLLLPNSNNSAAVLPSSLYS